MDVCCVVVLLYASAGRGSCKCRIGWEKLDGGILSCKKGECRLKYVELRTLYVLIQDLPFVMSLFGGFSMNRRD